MGLLQMLVRIPEKFANLAMMVLDTIFVVASDADRIDLDADQYPDISIKNVEHSRRRKDGKVVTRITSSQQFCPHQWKKFLANSNNKTNLMNFLVHQWSSDIYSQIDNCTVSHGSSCIKITADGRMFLHALHTSNNGHSQEEIAADIITANGTCARTRLIGIPRICKKIGQDVCKVLPGLHALTGCYSVSMFIGKGKKTALELVMNDDEMRTIGTLGERLPLGNEDMEGLERFVPSLYNDAGYSVDEARYTLFCKSKNLQSHQLPPTRDALEYHLKHANFQSYICKVLQANVPNRNPDCQGCKVLEDKLEIIWANVAPAPAPDAIMELMSCGCN